MATVELKHLAKTLGTDDAGVSYAFLKIQYGEFVVFVGRSGCGKSTLLRLVAGLDNSTSGDILIDENSANHLTPLPRKALSGGQRQRVASGRALARRPNVFLLDEPLPNVDTKLWAQIRGKIAAL